MLGAEDIWEIDQFQSFFQGGLARAPRTCSARSRRRKSLIVELTLKFENNRRARSNTRHSYVVNRKDTL